MEEPPTESRNPNSIPKFPRRRRRHLDSAIYRALVHLFSFRLDEAPNSDPNPSSENGKGTEIEEPSSSGNPTVDELAERKRNEEEDQCPNPRSEIGSDPVSDRNCIDVEKDSSFENPRLGSADGLGEEVPDEEKGPALAHPDSALESLQNEVLDTEELEIDDCDMEWLNNIMSDCAELIGGDDGPQVGEGTDGGPAKVVEFEKPVTVQEVAEGLIDDGEIEEGEIAGETDISVEPLTVHEDQKLSEPLCNNHTRTDSNIDSTRNPIVIKPTISGDNFASCTDVTQRSRKCETADPYTVNLSQENSEKLSIANKENTSEASDTKATERVKRKRGVLTAERKAKKKIAKKRKKAQKDREQGV